MKGFINKRPRKFKDVKKWSVDKVLKTIQDWGPNWNLEPKYITWKLAMLFALTGSNRVSELSYLDVNNMRKLPDGIEFQLSKPKKNRKAKILPGIAFYPCHNENPNLCPIKCLEAYLERTKKLRQEDTIVNLFRGIVKPHKNVKPCLISRWITNTIKEAGFEVTRQVGHSAGGKSASKAKMNKIALIDIMKAAEWKKSKYIYQTLLFSRA